MYTKEQRRAHALVKCRHFNGVQNKECKNHIKYPSVDKMACFGPAYKDSPNRLECEGYSTFTPEELDAQDAELERHIDLMRKGITSCCEAPIDMSQVIPSGRFKGHGPRFCSKCRKVVAMV